MALCSLLFVTCLIVLIYLINGQDISICNTTNCDNLDALDSSTLNIECTDQYCVLECENEYSCENILYSCGKLDDPTSFMSNSTSTCTINCREENSCSNLTVYSTAGKTDINCDTANSCSDASFVCNPSFEVDSNGYQSECNLNCVSPQSCDNIDYLCTGYISQCNANCNTCNGLDMTCYQYLDNIAFDDTTECDLSCNGTNSCDSSSQFVCYEEHGAICSCDGNCNSLIINGTVSVPTTTSSPSLSPTDNQIEIEITSEASRSHTFDTVDVEVYAIFTILWLLLFVISMILCWRLHVTLEFFRVESLSLFTANRKIATMIAIYNIHRTYEPLYCWYCYLCLRYFIIGYFVLYYGQMQLHIIQNHPFIFMYGQPIYP